MRLNDPDAWAQIRAVVFDVDGTLYHGPKLRRRMLLELGIHCVTNPRRLPLLRLLQTYRRERERLADEGATAISTAQYERPAARLGVSPQAVEQAVDVWIHERPLRHLPQCRVPGIERFFSKVRASGRDLGVLSDYPAEAKLSAMNLDAEIVVCATDPDVDRLKPHPAGLAKIVDRLGVGPSECLLVGDRDDRDGVAARRLDMPFVRRTDRPRAENEFTDYTNFEVVPGSGKA